MGAYCLYSFIQAHIVCKCQASMHAHHNMLNATQVDRIFFNEYYQMVPAITTLIGCMGLVIYSTNPDAGTQQTHTFPPHPPPASFFKPPVVS